jgi:hypothetical protein
MPDETKPAGDASATQTGTENTANAAGNEQTETSKTPPPADYSTLKLPEGSKLDTKRVEDVSAWAKAKNIAPEVAQEILNREHEAVSTVEAAQAAGIEKAKQAWLDELKADKEIGGDKLNAHVEPAKRLVDRFGSDKFKQALNETGLGNHPELVRFLAGIAKAVGEDKLVLPGASPAGGKKSVEEAFYGKPN